MDTSQKLQKMLKDAGQSLTAPRLAVFAALLHQEPLSMRKLVERCATIDRASVYRTVALFERLGIVQRLQTGWKYTVELADAFHDHHHHATCLQCGRTIILPESAVIEQHLRRMASYLNFDVKQHQVELQGYCYSCQKSAANRVSKRMQLPS